MAFWRFRSQAAIEVGYPCGRVAWQPGQGGLLACIAVGANPGGRLVKTGIVKKDSVEFGADMGVMEDLAWSPAGDLLATVGERAIIWNSSGTFNRELQQTPMGYIRSSNTPKFSNDASFIVLSNVIFGGPTIYREIRKFSTSTGALQQSLRISMLFPTLAWKDELEVFSRGENNTLNLWRIRQEEPLQTITLPVAYVNKMSFNPKMNILAFTSGRTVGLWKMDTPDMAVTILPHDAHVREFVWKSDNSDILATFDTLGDVSIWKTTTNIDIKIHTYNVFTIGGGKIRASFSPDGRFVAVGRRGEVKIVKFDTGDTVGVCEGSGEDVKWSPRGEKLAVNDLAADAPVLALHTYIKAVVFNVDKINFGINLKGLSKMRVANLLEGNLVNGKEEARNFLEGKIPEKLADDVLQYIM